MKSNCTKPETLILSLKRMDAMEYYLDSFSNPLICTKVISLLDEHFRPIPSLQNIVVEVYQKTRDSNIRREMENRGWVVDVREGPVQDGK